MALETAHHRFNLAEYHAMIEHGILTKDDRVELIAGEVVEKMSIGDPHVGCVNFLSRLFMTRLEERAATVTVQQPVAIPPDSEPEPDIMLLRPRADFYRSKRPRPADVLLLIEVADTSLRLDRSKKLPIYAKAGIPEVWIVDLNDNVIEVYTEPCQSGTYAQRRVVRNGEALAPAAFPDLTARASEIIGL